ncbi:trypsin-like peptidase domain-containing protein [Yeosuana sp. MJ-SS3]|uniref:Trypsin-like peptidase domain-containing protein n=1 Tax=Gilvirhabdus luticola TaxID=3079858 RepID=A0ABU3UAB7_9FLAO|nr:trypsin-like peptidase domain-containing protein [Yeosuana sp. MJ-SS3]MDU8887331.1 trypsin-like peptidase domain-containing protein [Yeosuana sp. MJ-SS3]
MKKIFGLVLVSALGGILTLSAYKIFLEPKSDMVVATTEQPTFLPTNHTVSNIYDTAVPSNFVEAAEKAVHSVVHVKNTAIVGSPTTLQDLLFGRSSQRQQIGTGSGVIVSPDGYIITNNHVINGSQALSVTLNNNKTYNAEIIGSDAKTDIALLKIVADEDLEYATFGDSDQAKIGEWVLAVGNPFNLTSTVTAGIISAKSRDLSGSSYQSFIQTDAAVNPGNSGGALVNTKGELIGINTAITSQTGSYIGYSFAVPSNIARKVIEDIMEYGNVQNGILGVTGGSLNSKSAEELDINTTEGFYVSEVVEDSGADKAGVKSGDIITKIDNVKISKFADLRGYLGTKRPEDVVKVSVLRNGDIKVLPVKLSRNETVFVPVIGVLKNANKNELKKFGVNNGLKISRLSDRYKDYWKNNGIKEGCIITAINDVKVKSVDDVEQIMSGRSDYEPLRIDLINLNGEKERYNFK